MREIKTSDKDAIKKTAFTIFAKKMRRERRIPFEVSVDPFYAESNIAYLNKKEGTFPAALPRNKY